MNRTSRNIKKRVIVILLTLLIVLNGILGQGDGTRFIQMGGTVFAEGYEMKAIQNTRIASEVTVTGDMTVTAAFVRIYTVTVRYDNTRGTIETQPFSSGGTIGAEKVTAEDGTAIQITATPNELYRVAGVVLKQGETVVADESYTDNTYTNANPYQKTITADADYELEITFAYQMQRVIAETPEHGTIQVSEEAVEYGGRSTVTMKPEQNYHIKEIRINDTLMQETECENGQEAEDGTFQFDLVNICEDKRIQVIFEENEEISFENGVTFNSMDAIRKEGTNQYIYAKDARVIFRAADGLEIRITDDKNQEIKWNSGTKVIELTETTIIQRIRVRKAGFFSFIYKWADVTLPDGQLRIVIDKEAPVLTMTPDAANEYGYYNGDVNVQLQAEEAGIPDETDAGRSGCSGISKVEYWVTCDGEITQGKGYTDGDTTDDGILYEAMSGETVQTSVTERVTVEAARNNSDNTVLHVAVTDHAGNTREEQLTLKINTTAPEVSYVMEGTKAAEAVDGYYNTDRTAVITYMDRAGSFDKTLAFDGIKISARDAEDNEILMQTEYLNPVWQEEGDTHILTLTFSQDANYEWTISYTNKAGLEAQKVTGVGENLRTFTVDKTAPTGSVQAVSAEGRTAEWSGLRSVLTYGFCSKQEITVSCTKEDLTSPIKSVDYYVDKVENTAQNTAAGVKPLTRKELDSITGWQSFRELKLTDNVQGVVYVRIRDKAGNYTYLSTDGLMIDKQNPLVEYIAPEVSVDPEKPVNGIYRDDVKVDLSISDPVTGGTCSGLGRISYRVYNRAVNAEQPTQSGDLYVQDAGKQTAEELIKKWSGSITVDSTLNNSNDVLIVITAWDNAGNSVQAEQTIRIDKTAPKIQVRYDNNQAVNDTYFRGDRHAYVSITERNFDPSAVQLSITNTDGVMPEISDWSRQDGSGNQDDTVWTAVITYQADGDYTFGIRYTDMAGNPAEGVEYAAGTAAPEAFTIDKTVPVVSVSYDNRDARNGNYYNAARTATITVTEHNFNADLVDIRVTAARDGAEAARPSVSGWQQDGDRHTATITYSGDALYTFQLAVRDMVGNEAERYPEESFYIDTTAPELEIQNIADQAAYNGEVMPVITGSDANYDPENLTVQLTGTNRGAVNPDGTYTRTQTGGTFTFRNFANTKEADDIYTLQASLTDRAGNTTTKEVTFSVNRFGSTYEFGDVAKRFNSSYVKDAEDVVITEVNANALKNIRLTLFKNNQTIVLTEGTDYRMDVTGGNGKWYRYVYTIFKKNFEDDGAYRLNIHSEDGAGNVAENTLDTKGAELRFGVDKTAPNIVLLNLESHKTYAVDQMTAEVSASDNLLLKTVAVYLDDYSQPYRIWNEKEVAEMTAGNQPYTFDISGDSIHAHNVKVVTTDAAGNEQVAEAKGFFVTTNLWIRYYTNKGLFFGTIGGVIGLAAFIVFLVSLKRRRREGSR